MVRVLFILILVLFSSTIAAQEESQEVEKKVIQLSGIVLTGDSLMPVPFTTVYRTRDVRGTLSDLEGFFTISAFEGDTVQFSNVGFIPANYVIPEGLEENRYSMVQILEQDTIQLPTATIYPWPSTVAKFKEEFLALELSSSPDFLMAENVRSISSYDGMMDVGMHSSASYAVLKDQQYQDLYYAGQNPTSGLFNPIAWASFIKDLRSGKLKRK